MSIADTVADARAGHCVLRSSHTEWSVEDTVRTYWGLTEPEATFRSLKFELGLRPVWHQLSKRVDPAEYATAWSAFNAESSVHKTS